MESSKKQKGLNQTFFSREKIQDNVLKHIYAAIDTMHYSNIFFFNLIAYFFVSIHKDNIKLHLICKIDFLKIHTLQLTHTHTHTHTLQIT
jgi:hypothetical protein